MNDKLDDTNIDYILDRIESIIDERWTSNNNQNKKTILRLNKIVSNFPRNETVLRDEIKSEMYSLLKNAYLANNSEVDRRTYQNLMLVNIKMVDFYINESYTSKYIS